MCLAAAVTRCETRAHPLLTSPTSTVQSNAAAGSLGCTGSSRQQRLVEEFVCILFSPVISFMIVVVLCIHCYEYLTVITLESADEAILT